MRSKKNFKDFDKILEDFKRSDTYVSKISFNKYIDSLLDNSKLEYSLQIFNDLLSKNESLLQHEIKFGFVYSKHIFGSSTKNSLVLSKPLLHALSFDDIYFLVCHEFAHVLNYNIKLTKNKKAYMDDHGNEWKRLYKKLSGKSEYEINNFENNLSLIDNNFLCKYHLICLNGCSLYSDRKEKNCMCGKEWERVRIRYE